MNTEKIHGEISRITFFRQILRKLLFRLKFFMMNAQDIILDHYHHPRHLGLLRRATHHAETANLSCGDSLTMDIVAKDDIIEQVGWIGNGCALSQAAASLLSESLSGKTLEEARALSKENLFALIGTDTLSPVRAKCALLTLETLHRALSKNPSEELLDTIRNQK